MPLSSAAPQYVGCLVDEVREGICARSPWMRKFMVSPYCLVRAMASTIGNLASRFLRFRKTAIP